jgi:nucleoside phosphorylase
LTTSGSAPQVLLESKPAPVVGRSLPGVGGDVSGYFAFRLDGLRQKGADDADRTDTALGQGDRIGRVLSRFAGRAAAELRIRVDPGSPRPVVVWLIGRAWARHPTEARQSTVALREQIQDVLAEEFLISSPAGPQEIQSAMRSTVGAVRQAACITKKELTAAPVRPDAGSVPHLATSSFSGGRRAWAEVYRSLSYLRIPLEVSVALFPVRLPRDWTEQLASRAAHYDRLAGAADVGGDLFYGRRRIGPDLFAARAARSIRDLLHRWSREAYFARIQVAAPRLPVDLVELVGSALTDGPTDPSATSTGFDPAYEIRWFTSADELGAARWNLAALDCYQPEVRAWRRPASTWSTPRDDLLTGLVDLGEAASIVQLPTQAAGGAAVLPTVRADADHADDLRADVLVLTVTEVETSELRQSLLAAGAQERVVHGSSNTYRLYEKVAGTAVAHVRCSMGSAAAGGSTLTVAAAIAELRPWAVVAVGIAFGVDEQEQPLSSVLLSETLTTYESQRLGEDEGGGLVIRERGHTVPGSPTLLARFRDGLPGSVGVRVIPGQILSGEKLVDNASEKARLLARFPDAVGGEMEGSGVFAASHRSAVEWLVVKAVSDHGASKRVDKAARQQAAAAAAADSFAAVLRQGGLRRRAEPSGR